MKIQYLGTAAAEGIPAFFCHCDTCKKAAKLGGKNLRTRSQALIDGEILIDWNADTLSHAQRFGLDLAAVEILLITHVHSDHLYTEDFEMRIAGFAHFDDCERLNVFGSEDLKNRFPIAAINAADQYGVTVNIVKPFEPFKAGGHTVTALKAAHGTENPYIYIIESDGKTMLYAHDTGLLPDESYNYIKDNKIVFNMISLDCTEGIKPIGYDAHMNFERCRHTADCFKKDGIITDETVKVLNHFSHNGGTVLYDDLTAAVKEYGFSVSYDGMTVEF